MLTREEFLKNFKQSDWPIEKQKEMRIFEEKLKLFGGLTRPGLERLADELSIRLQMAMEIVRYLFCLESKDEREVMKKFLEFYLDGIKKRIHDFSRDAADDKAD